MRKEKNHVNPDFLVVLKGKKIGLNPKLWKSNLQISRNACSLSVNISSGLIAVQSHNLKKTCQKVSENYHCANGKTEQATETTTQQHLYLRLGAVAAPKRKSIIGEKHSFSLQAANITDSIVSHVVIDSLRAYSHCAFSTNLFHGQTTKINFESFIMLEELNLKCMIAHLILYLRAKEI